MEEKKYLSYLILPNYIYENKYQKVSYQVFNDSKLGWKPIDNFSQYWYQFPEYLAYSYPAMKKVLKLITDEMLEEDCTYHREKFGVLSALFLKQKMGETLFLKYLSQSDMNTIIGSHNLEKTKIIVR